MQIKRDFQNPAPGTSSQGLPALALASILSLACHGALAQGSPLPGHSPLPGGYGHPSADTGSFQAPIPGGRPASLPVQSGATHAGHGAAAVSQQGIYNQLPINVEEARIRLEDLSNRLAVSRPDEVKDGIYALSEWLQDVADAHWRMFKAFEKSDATRAHANKEKEIALKFSGLKNRAKLLKADLLIKQNRYPEALGPLVEIVTAEPTSATGQDAYKRLVDMGFSEQVSSLELAAQGAKAK